ncbi:MAG: hypothetical protein ACPGTO_07865 [Polaribacter sp.]
MEIQIEQTNDYLELAKLNESVQTLHHRLYPENFKKYDLSSATIFFKNIVASTDTYAFLANVNSKSIGYILCLLRTKKENEFQYEKKNTLYRPNNRK